jgi:hypothetical protein
VDRVSAESPGGRGQQSDSCGSWRTSRCRNPWSLGPALPCDRSELAAQLAARHALLRLSGKRAPDRRGHEADGDRARLCGRNRRSFAHPPVSRHRHLTGFGAQMVAVRGGRLRRQHLEMCGDQRVRTHPYEAANVMLTRCKGQLKLKDWAFAIAKRSTMRTARVALARRQRQQPSALVCILRPLGQAPKRLSRKILRAAANVLRSATRAPSNGWNGWSARVRGRWRRWAGTSRREFLEAAGGEARRHFAGAS